MGAQSSRTEIKRLKDENEKLRAEIDKLVRQPRSNIAKPRTRNMGSLTRSIGVSLLVLLAVALLAIANLLFWFGNTAVKQDRFVAATEPLIKDPVVQESVALYATNSIFNNTDVQKVTEDVLPPRADFLAPQLTTQLRSFTNSTLQKTLAKPAVQDKWNQTLAKQHARLINLASKHEGNGDISLNEVYSNLNSSLASSKLSFLANKQLPPKVGDITVVNASWLPAFHNLVVNIDTWRLLAVIVLVISLASAVWLSRKHRRTLYIFSQATVILMIITLIALQIVKQSIVERVDPQYAEGVRQALQIMFSSLVAQTFTIIAAAGFIWLITWVSGPSRSAAALKRQIELLFSGKLHTRIFADENKYTSWIQKNKHMLQWAVVAIFAVIMLLVRLTLLGLLAYATIMLVLVLAIEVLGGQPAVQKRPVR